MRRGQVLPGAAAIAAVVLGIVVVLVLRLRTELADAVPRLESTIADTAEEPTRDPPDADPAALAGVDAVPAAACVSSEPATPATPATSARTAARRAAIVRRNIAEARERLLASRDSEHLAAAALLSLNVSERVDDITSAFATGRQNPAIVWTAVRICAAAGDAVPCPAQQWEDQLLKLDWQNSEVWIHVATRRLERGDGKGALAALQRAASATETNAYWPDTIELLERGLAAAGGYSFPERASIAGGVAAAHQPDYASYLSMCKTQSQVDRAWADACLHYGEVAERQSKTVLAQTSARSLQIAVLEIVGDGGSVTQVRARGRDTVATSEERRRADAAITSGPRLFARYLAKLRESGELAAVAYMLEEAESLPSQPVAAECPQPGARD